jgi:hypothetical protein
MFTERRTTDRKNGALRYLLSQLNENGDDLAGSGVVSGSAAQRSARSQSKGAQPE